MAAVIALGVFLGGDNSRGGRDVPAIGLGEACDVGRDAGCESTGTGSMTSIQQLGKKYSPILYVGARKSACDPSSSALGPMPVTVLLDNPEIALRRKDDGSFIKLGPTASDLFHAGADTYLDFPGNPRSPGCRYQRDEERFRQDARAVTYAHVIGEERTGELALQYWFFYYFNDWNNKHEGDWEMIQLSFDTLSTEEALTRDPIRIAYSQHRGGEVAFWHNPIVRREGNHPVIFVADGSHAGHFEPSVYVGRGEQRTGFGCDDSTAPRVRLEPAVVTLPHEPRSQNSPFAWLAYKGNWGEMAGSEFAGPTGPMSKWQWWAPFMWEDSHVRTSSLRAEPTTSFGPDAVAVFCRLVAVGTSKIFPHVNDRPWLSAMVAGVFSIGAVSTLSRTRYFPVRALPLRSRRHIGQILIAALDVYRQRAFVFAAIGLLSIPITLVTSNAQWQATEALSFTPFLGIPLVESGQRLTLLMALGALHLGFVYALVALAVTATLGRMSGGMEVSAWQVLRDLWHKLPDLALPRLLAILIVSALAFTIVGIPLALRQAIRWAFIEQAVILDGASGRAAMSQSSAVVGGSWWWAAGTVVGLGALALAVPPAAGIVLILTMKSAPFLYINVVAAVIQACLVPYISIALALAYFDLKTKAAR